MHSNWAQPETARVRPQYDYHTSPTHGQPPNREPVLPVTQPSRSLEPRPTLHTSLSEPFSAMSRPSETYGYREGPTPDHRSRSQNLPGLKDILNPDPYSPSSQSYGQSWSPSGGRTSIQRDNDSLVVNGVHPPMVLHPPVTSEERYHSNLHRPLDVRNYDSHRLSQPPPISPRGVFPDQGREYVDPRIERPNHAYSGLYLSNGAPSPFNAVLPEEANYRREAGEPQRSSRTGNAGTTADSRGTYLGVEDVVGEGKFYVYSDGHRIPTQIDGEQVNPAWGLTKANKPRKRLALACLDCREKKIKCEPGTNSCVQCEKAMRPCRKAPEKYSQADTSANYYVGSPIRRTAFGSEASPSSHRNTESDPLSKRRTRADPSPPLDSNKRHRSASPRTDPLLLDDRRGDKESPQLIGPSDAAADSGGDEPLMWENDPYAVNPEATVHLLELYFKHINNATYCIWPRRHFMHWLKSYPKKCQNERMVLYAMLALASIHADEQLAGFGKQCAQIAGDAISSEGGRFNVAAAQCKMMLALYHFAKGAHGLAWDHVGAAIRTVTHMSLNTEDGCLDDEVSKTQPRYEFAFSPEQLAECKRRTFWSCFLQDRYCGPTMCMIKPQDIFVRLPCTDHEYERSILNDAPYFTNDVIHQETTPVLPTSSLAPMAWLVLIHAIWGDVTDFIFRASHRPRSTYREAYETFYNQTQRRVGDWLSSLPDYLQNDQPNLDMSIQQGYVGTFVSMHIMYHMSMIKLNRYMRHSVMSDSTSHNIRTANHHGHRILQLMTALSLARREISAPSEGQAPVCTFTTPFPGYAILSAIDIVSAGGLDSNLRSTLDEIDGALGCLRELAPIWKSSKDQLRACEKRFYQLKNITITPKTARSGCWLGRKWGIKTPLEQEFGPENDCIYGLGEQEADEAMGKYFDAFKER